MNVEALKDGIKQELPAMLREDPTLRAYILHMGFIRLRMRTPRIMP